MKPSHRNSANLLNGTGVLDRLSDVPFVQKRFLKFLAGGHNLVRILVSM